MRLAVVLLAIACARAPVLPEPPAAASEQTGEEIELALISNILADACTSAPTDAVLIEHATFLLKACHFNVHVCMRRVCVRLGKADESDPYSEASRKAALEKERAELEAILRANDPGFHLNEMRR